VLGHFAYAMNPTIMRTPSVKRGDYNVVPSFSSTSTASPIALVEYFIGKNDSAD